MKKLVLITIIISFYSHILKAQTISGYYIKQMKGGVGDDSKLSENAQIPEIYEYMFSNNKSSLIKLTKGGTVIDTLKNDLNGYEIDNKVIETTIKMSDYELTKNLSSKTFKNKYCLKNKEYYINDSLPTFIWNISNDTKIINGFICKKATTTHISFGYKLPITAWFCEQIPIKDGPFHFHNLPGFIFELTSKNYFTIEFIYFKYDENKSTEVMDIETDIKPQTIKELEKNWKE
ncbi:GLPGLI family protein [uncultured Flavobacterium sp.]|uniref:GLPGLI family protein n=1 Tax=uncultured Flavobacterium sp. TaxID=165435 RepID=UPI0030C88B0C